MAVMLKVRQRDKPLRMTVSTPEPVQLSVAEHGGRGAKEYEGDYTIIPILNTDRTFETFRKIMKEDLEVKAIPVVQTTNIYGGKTVVIG